MKKQNEKDELQSRREFFRNAAKAALPVLGAIVLSGSPLLSHAMESQAMDCKGGCKGSCTGNCAYGCERSCIGTCKEGCGGGCKTTCSYACRNGAK